MEMAMVAMLKFFILSFTLLEFYDHLPKSLQLIQIINKHYFTKKKKIKIKIIFSCVPFILF